MASTVPVLPTVNRPWPYAMTAIASVLYSVCEYLNRPRLPVNVTLLGLYRGVDNFFKVEGLRLSRVTPHASRGVWGHAAPGNF